MKTELRLKDSETGKEYLVTIQQGNPLFLNIGIEGHGDYVSEDGCGFPLTLEIFNGKLLLNVWADINKEDPTHIIDLEGAREDKRIPDKQE